MLTLFPTSYTPAKLPSGSFTVDKQGAIVVSTLPSAYPRKHLTEIARNILKIFRSSEKVSVPMQELVVRYSSMTISAKELRGGAIIYLRPVTTLG